DSYNIAKEAVDSVRELIDKKHGEKYLPSSPNIFQKKSSAAAQEAHECIRPTDVFELGDDIDDGDEKKMYSLIRDRFIACQMTPMVVDTVVYNIKTDVKHALIARGQSIKFDGWYKAYKHATAKDENLPEAKDGEKLSLKDIKKTKHSTQPPPRFNDGSLITKMEGDGVGRPSTRASIIKSIQDKGYVEKDKAQKNAFVPTPLGMQINDFLSPKFKDFFMDIKFTAGLEEDLDLIAKGEKTFIDVVQKVYDFMIDQIKQAKLDTPEKAPLESTGKKCPECKKGEIVLKPGKFGEFYTCNGYPTCKTVFIKNEDGTFSIKNKPTVKKTGRTCPECEKHNRKGELVERANKKDGSVFIGCTAYPRCKYSESVK
ncbi:MAG: DNA topoisomerase, partial [Methanomassiliicoccales archaeon]